MIKKSFESSSLLIDVYSFPIDGYQNARKLFSKGPASDLRIVCGFFLSVKFATSLLASLAGG